MKRYQKMVLNISIVVFILILSFLLPFIKSFLNQTMNSKFIEKVRKYALSANIKVVQLKYRKGENSSSTSVSPGASGIIFRKEGNKYYALTARHVIEKADNVDKTQIIIMGYDDLDFADSLSKGGKFQGVAIYYQQFPQAVVEYSSNNYDLAIISFTTDKVYTVLPISNEAPKYGEVVASISNPNGKRNIITAGNISSKRPVPFGDEAGKMQYPIIRHTSEISEGSSGSALLNENLQIVGINLGGSKNIFRQHIYGMAMPSNYILDFLEEWKH